MEAVICLIGVVVVFVMALAFCRAAGWADDWMDDWMDQTTETQRHGEEKDRLGG